MNEEDILQSKVRLVAERFLSRRDYTRDRLINVLVALPKRFPLSKNYIACTPSRVRLIVEALEQEGIIDDYRYGLRLWDRCRLSHGFRACIALLRRRKVKPEAIERLVKEKREVISQVSPEFLSLVQKKYDRLINKYSKEPRARQKAQNACYRFLAGRGYTFSEAKSIIDYCT